MLLSAVTGESCATVGEGLRAVVLLSAVTGESCATVGSHWSELCYCRQSLERVVLLSGVTGASCATVGEGLGKVVLVSESGKEKVVLMSESCAYVGTKWAVVPVSVVLVSFVQLSPPRKKEREDQKER